MSGIHEGGKNDARAYSELGFMCGLEIHQRLATSQKLFCSCPAGVVTEGKSSGTIFRYQRAVAGELGAVDRSAQFEELRGRRFIYNLYKGHTCLVDIDEEPPHALSGEALDISLQVAAALKLKTVDELEPMRKEVVDGSNPSAFQRTVLIGTDGSINIEGRRINITMMSLEEESAGISSSTHDSITYDSDRIGIPLVEIDTDPYIATPEEAKKTALHIGMLLRLTGRVQRGIGTIRQDVNVSIKGGARVEIKGLQELDTMDKFIENEVLRQQRLIAAKEELAKRNAGVGDAVDLSGALKGSKAKIIGTALAAGGVVLGVALRGFSGMMGFEVNPGRRLGTEISDYAKMGGVKGIIHSDEDLSSYGLQQSEVAAIRGALGIKEGDAFMLVAAPMESASKAIELAIGRARQALLGVPLETRGVASTDAFTTKFLRPLPGGARMYPETDVRPVRLTPKMLDDAIHAAPDIEREKRRLTEELGSAQTAEALMLSPRLPLYRKLAAQRGTDRAFIANTLLQKFTELKRAGFDADAIPEEKLARLFDAYVHGMLTKQAVEEVLKGMCGSDASVEGIIKGKGLGRIKGKELEEFVERFKKEHKGIKDGDLMRSIMQGHRLNIDGAELTRLLSGHKSQHASHNAHD